MELSLAQIVTGGLLAGVIAAIGLILNQKSQLVRIETLLTGANGDNGLIGDLKQIKEWRADVEAHALPLRVATLEQERRHGPDDRRASA